MENAKHYKDYLLEIYKVEAEKYNKTRHIQWKMNFAVWTVAILAAHFHGEIFSDNMIKSIGYNIIILICALFLLCHFFFILIIHSSTNRSLSRMNNMANKLTEVDGAEYPKWETFISPKKGQMDCGNCYKYCLLYFY